MIAECLERLHQKLEKNSLPSYSLASCYEYGDRIYKNSIQVTPLWEVKKYRREHGVAEPVDLGLSVKWASRNLGAPCQEQPGYYVGWGDVTCMNQSTYYEDYPVADNISGTQLDPATVLWRETWRMPTTAEMLELMQNCQWMWTVINGVTGFMVTGKTGNGIFLPAGGNRYGCQFEDAYYFGRYWCGQIDENDNARAYLLEFSQTSGQLFTLARHMGLLIRPVLG